jgi:MFS family permease
MGERSNAENPVARSAADINWRRFIAFRVLFNARFYYPVLAVLFLDFGLSVEQYTLLNFAWALSIVCLDLPAGALADHIGRRPLVIAAAVCMVVEMILIAFAPFGHPALLFWVFLANRVISGMAEAAASGADEALVFDSLAEQGRSDEWPHVLDHVIKWQSAGFIAAMLIGAAVYDPVLMQRAANAMGLAVHLTQQDTMRFPLYLNLVTACITLVVAIGLREPSGHLTHSECPTNPLSLIAIAGRWILRTPFALLIIVAGFLHDSVIRLFLTFGSSYYRLIGLPAYSFGFIGAGMAALGFFVSPVAKNLVKQKTFAFNFILLALLTFGGLAGVAAHWRHVGVLFVVPLGIAMYLLNFFVSYYLNSIAKPDNRATILSFKGLAFNLGYGAVGLLFAGLFRLIKAADGIASEETVFARALFWVPVYFAVTLLLLAFASWGAKKSVPGRPDAPFGSGRKS